MQIKRLQIDDYLCLVDFDIVFDTVSGGSSTILIGENGAGKSTMIECILNILMSFDSPAIEKQIDYSYSMEYNYAQKAVCIVQSKHRLTRAHREKQLKMSCQALHNAPPNRT